MSGQDGTDVASPADLLTPQSFFAWQQSNAGTLWEREDCNARAVQDAVIRAIQPMMQQGMRLADAGDILAQRFCYGCRDGVTFTPSAVHSALRAIGWKAPKRKHAKGGEA